MGAYEKFTVKLTKATDTQRSEAFQIPEWANYTAVFIPDIDAGDMSLEWIDPDDVTAAKLAVTNDTSWHPVGDPTDGADAVICASGNDPMVVDISVFVRALAGRGYVRFKTGAAQTTADVTFTIHVVG